MVRIPKLSLLAVWGAVGGWLLWPACDGDAPYHLIEDGLYLGASVERPPMGTRAVVNLCGRQDPYEVEAALWTPIYEDGPGKARSEPTLDLVRRVAAFIDEQRKAGRPTYVHCMMGQNRSAAMVAAYLMVEHGLGRDQALARLRQRRPMVQPDPALLRLLWQWEQALRH